MKTLQQKLDEINNKMDNLYYELIITFDKKSYDELQKLKHDRKLIIDQM